MEACGTCAYGTSPKGHMASYKREADSSAVGSRLPMGVQTEQGRAVAAGKDRQIRKELSINMSAIMELFRAELNEFQQSCEKLQWKATFYGEKYPPKMVICGNPVYVQQTMDGMEKNDEQTMTVVVSGGVDPSVALDHVRMQKKDVTKVISAAEKLLNLYLHAFMEEQLEHEL